MKMITYDNGIVKYIADEGFIFQNKENKNLLSKEIICGEGTIIYYDEIVDKNNENENG